MPHPDIFMILDVKLETYIQWMAAALLTLIVMGVAILMAIACVETIRDHRQKVEERQK